MELNQYEEKMKKSLANLEEEYGAIRAGRANPRILDRIQVDYYGTPTSLQGVANISVPEARMMQIQPHVICEVEDNISRRYMLNKGLGNAFVPSNSRHEDDTFRTYSLNPPFTFYIVAAYPKNITLSEPMKQMIRILLTHFDHTAL